MFLNNFFNAQVSKKTTKPKIVASSEAHLNKHNNQTHLQEKQGKATLKNLLLICISWDAPWIRQLIHSYRHWAESFIKTYKVHILPVLKDINLFFFFQAIEIYIYCLFILIAWKDESFLWKNLNDLILVVQITERKGVGGFHQHCYEWMAIQWVAKYLDFIFFFCNHIYLLAVIPQDLIH